MAFKERFKIEPFGDFAGFMIGGYRSFHGAPQKIAPLGRVTLIAGPNNSGKSNALLAAPAIISAIKDRNASDFRSDMDKPLLKEGQIEMPLTIGVAIKPRGEPVEALTRALDTQAPGKRTNTYVALSDLINAPALHGDPDDLIWLRLIFNDGSFRYDPDLIKQLNEETKGHSSILTQISQNTMRGSSTDFSITLQTYLERLRFNLACPAVVSVPSARRIAANGSPSPELTDLSGSGLPGMLLALQAPSANRYREDRAKFRKINEFLKHLLEDETVEIIVPHDSSTVHIGIGDRVLPLENLGAGISQVLLLATISTWYTETLICIEEPETNLNPVMLRKLVQHFQERTSNQYLMATHSANLLDSRPVVILRASYAADDEGTQITNALTSGERAAVAQHLGYRASDIIQANSLIWVEGPSDRIYLNKWISLTDPELIEGVHYSTMFYGGRLLSHLSGQEADLPEENTEDFIMLLKINRHMAILIDSDKRSAKASISATKRRLEREFADNGGLSWITSGKEIENYVPTRIFEPALKVVHPTTRPKVREGQYSNLFASITLRRGQSPEGRIKTPDKVRVAEECVSDAEEVWDVLDLRERVNELVRFIRQANTVAGQYHTS